MSILISTETNSTLNLRFILMLDTSWIYQCDVSDIKNIHDSQSASVLHSLKIFVATITSMVPGDWDTRQKSRFPFLLREYHRDIQNSSIASHNFLLKTPLTDYPPPTESPFFCPYICHSATHRSSCLQSLHWCTVPNPRTPPVASSLSSMVMSGWHMRLFRKRSMQCLENDKFSGQSEDGTGDLFTECGVERTSSACPLAVVYQLPRHHVAPSSLYGYCSDR